MDIPKIIKLEVSSPEDLRGRINTLLRQAASVSNFVSLSINSPQILTRLFEHEVKSPLPLKEQLKLDSAELLSLPAADAVFDFQIMESSAEKQTGVYACMPQKLLEEYMRVLDQYGFVPVKVAPRSLDGIAHAVRGLTAEERICVLEFKGPLIFIAIFTGKTCELLRTIHDEKIEDAKNEIILSVRSASGKSKVKDIHRIVALGANEAHQGMVDELASFFRTSAVKEPHFISEMDTDEKPLFTLNLSREYAFDMPARKNLFEVSKTALKVLVCVAIFLGALTIERTFSYFKTKSSYKKEDLEYAVKLKKKLDSL